MRFQTKDVTPKMAARYLSNNPNNRTARKHYAARLAADMSANAWIENGDVLRFNCDGALMDGQHRLMAIVLSGKTIRMALVSGLKESAMKTIDSGPGRTGADYLKVMGENNCNHLHAALTLLWKWRHKTLATNDSGDRPTVTQVEKYLRRNKGIVESVSACNTISMRGFGVGSFLMFLHYVTCQEHHNKANSFMDGLEGGIGLTKDSAVYHLREILLRDRGAIRPMTPKHKKALVIKAWNKHLAGEKTRTLRWSGFNEKPEAFPEIQL